MLASISLCSAVKLPSPCHVGALKKQSLEERGSPSKRKTGSELPSQQPSLLLDLSRRPSKLLDGRGRGSGRGKTKWKLTSTITGIYWLKNLKSSGGLVSGPAVDFPGGSVGKESACSVGDLGSSPGLGRSSGEGNGNLLQYSCLENSTDRGAWWATIHEVTKSWTRLSD